ncbi:MAG: hypothetical protein OXM02_05070 [Bacteroidota bacterium]|nr:hypothetical protein [Bacteroidota bacterium]MDE2833873.1 hypothetical protein [Bacteroidota bacterium]MDE2958137.1 hypothetical protein [Bacteroidota bacterium]
MKFGSIDFDQLPGDRWLKWCWYITFPLALVVWFAGMLAALAVALAVLSIAVHSIWGIGWGPQFFYDNLIAPLTGR